MEHHIKDIISAQTNPTQDDVQKLIVDLQLSAAPTALTYHYDKEQLIDAMLKHIIHGIEHSEG